MKIGLLGVIKIKHNKWKSCLDDGLKWEEKLLAKIDHILLTTTIQRIDYTQNPNTQREGIDGVISKKQSSIEIKTRKYFSYKYKDILLETKSVIEQNILGWFYTTNADIIAYVWENDSRTNLIDGYLIFISKELRHWFDENKHKFKKQIAETESENGNWHTENYAVPINAFPKGTTYRFNPRLNFTQQSKLFA